MAEYLKNDCGKNSVAFPGKIAVVTMPPSVNEDDYHSVDRLVAKYGPDKIIHATWPEDFINKQEKMTEIVAGLAADNEIKILILNQAVEGSNAAVDKFKETRDDVFIVYCTVNEKPAEVALRANLVILPNELGMGLAMVKQARKQGAKVFVHYSFPRHMAIQVLSDRRDAIRDTCAEEDMVFIDSSVPDPLNDGGIAGARQFILEDVPKLVSKYGDNIAFYCSNCHMQVSLIKAVIENHAIYPQPCCPSPYHGFPEAIGINKENSRADLRMVISEACRIAEEKNMTDRLSTWPVSASMMFTNVGAEYAILRLNGDVGRNRIDDHALENCMNSYIKEVVGEGVKVELASFEENGVTYNNFKLVLMSYLDF